MRIQIQLLLVVLAFLVPASLAACATPTPGSTLGPRPTEPDRTATPSPADDQEAIRQLVSLEGMGVVSQDITGLMGLWSDDAVITDAKHTPDDPTDDAHWRGKDAIRERYVVLVFPGNPLAAGNSDLQISVEGDQAVAVGSTHIGDEVSPNGDRWTFVKRDARWWITSLTYNLEAP